MTRTLSQFIAVIIVLLLCVIFSQNLLAQETTVTPDEVLGQRIAAVSRRKSMSNEHGQFYREYDITPYTQRRGLDPASHPEQTITDWIFRQTTGTAAWHAATESVLAATPERLYVYHQIDVQKIAADVVDRFVSPDLATDHYTARLISLARPDWLARTHVYLRPIPIQSVGVQGWLLDKNEQSRFFADIARRSDYRDYTTAPVAIPNGVRHEIVSLRPRSYTRDVQPSTQFPGYVADIVSLDEGFRFTLVPLSCLDGQASDITLDGQFTQVERMNQVSIDMVNPLGTQQRHTIESPQLVTNKFDEQIRFPKDKVLMLDLGMWGALPEQTTPTTASTIISSITKVVSPTAGRVNYLLLIECHGARSVQSTIATNVASSVAANTSAIPAPITTSPLPASSTASPSRVRQRY